MATALAAAQPAGEPAIMPTITGEAALPGSPNSLRITPPSAAS